MTAPIPQRVAHRALTRHVVDENGCHISTYSVGSHGYAQIGWQHERGVTKRECTTAHRAAWTAVHGPIPDGFTVDHECKVRRCVNVAHLRLLDNFENSRRTGGRDWPLGECANGHSNEHLRVLPSGRRRCQLCRVDHLRRYREKKKEAA